MDQIVTNFNKMFNRTDLFVQASNDQIDKLKKIIGNDAKLFIDFFSKFQPNNIPMLNSYVQLIDIEHMIKENVNGEPGKFLADFGVYVFALTVGGNVLCIDTNNVQNGDVSVLIADAIFCSYNDEYDCVEIGIIPDNLLKQLDENKILILNYENIKKCLKKIDDSFIEFMRKLSNDEYDDIEEFLE